MINKIEKIRKVLIISNRLTNEIVGDIDNHYAAQTSTDLLYPLTHSPESYIGVKNVKISDIDIFGRNRPQYLVPLGHEHNPKEMLLKPSIAGDKYFFKHEKELQKAINMSNNLTLKKIKDYFTK